MQLQKSNGKHSIGFEPEEVMELIGSLIDRKINTYKIEFMQHWEADHNFDAEAITKKIKQLSEKKEKMQLHFKQAKENSQALDFHTLIKILI